MNTTTVCKRRASEVQRNLSDECLPIRRYQPSVPDTVLEALPARLVVRSERHSIRDTNHTAADQPCAASRQGNCEAEARVSNSSSKRDLQQHGGDESTFEHAHVQLAKHEHRVLEQGGRGGQQTIGFRQTCKAEEDGDHEQNRSPTFESLQLDSLPLAPMCSFPHVFVTSWTLETHVLFETKIGCEELPTMMFQQIVFSFR